MALGWPEHTICFHNARLLTVEVNAASLGQSRVKNGAETVVSANANSFVRKDGLAAGAVGISDVPDRTLGSCRVEWSRL